MPSVEVLNQLPAPAAREALGPCCSSTRWVDAVVAGRPYAGIDALLDASDATVTALGERDLAEALAEGNAAYERRFGHIYLACATGRTAGELLTFLRDRLGNDRAAEWRVVAAELAKI